MALVMCGGLLMVLASGCKKGKSDTAAAPKGAGGKVAPLASPAPKPPEAKGKPGKEPAKLPSNMDHQEASRCNAADGVDEKAAQQKLKTAERNLRKMIRRNPKKTWFLVDLGRVLFKQNKMKKGLSMVKKGVALDPKDIFAKVILGYALVLHGKTAQGLKYLRSAMSIAPSNPGIQCNLMVAFRKAGATDDADSMAKMLSASKYKCHERCVSLESPYTAEGIGEQAKGSKDEGDDDQPAAGDEAQEEAAADEAPKPVKKEAAKPAADEAAKPAADEAAKPAADEAAKPAADEAAKGAGDKK